jgi:hypothetical protein
MEERDYLEKPKLRWEDNIKIDIKKEGRVGVDWIDLCSV